MDPIRELFDRMDAWRQFPNYQLERRADLFFSIYLPEVLEATFGCAFRRKLVPEFPVRKGTIYPNIPGAESCKIDYVALSAAGDKVVFVELKTEGRSRREEQDKYLAAAQRVGLSGLLDGLLKIFRATNSKRKYFRLLEHLETLSLLRIPARVKEIMARENLQSVTEASREIVITANASDCLVVYVQPSGTGSEIVSFAEFAEVVRRHDDPVSQRFGESLRTWAEVGAGYDIGS